MQVDSGHNRDSARRLQKVKMSEEEQVERMKRNQERMANRKKPPLPAPCALTQEV